MIKEREAVLIVDDQPNWRDLLSSVLSDEYETTCVEGYAQAVEAIDKRKTPFALALIDIRLRDEDPHNEEGMELLRTLTELSVPTSVIIITGYPTFRTTKEALKNLQAFDYVLKYPEDGSAFSLTDFRNTVREAVAQSVKRREELLPNQKALVIEDESNWQETLSSELADSGYFVDCATDFEEAVDKVKNYVYRLVIVDLKLGNFSPQKGMELLGEIREINKDTEIIVVSAWDTSERVRDAFAKYRVRDFLMKSGFNIQQFREAIEQSESSGSTRSFAALPS